MQTVNRRAWFTEASNSLELIEVNLGEYQNDERVAPSKEVIEAVRCFLGTLGGAIPDGKDIAEVKLNVSVNGHIVVTLGKAPQTLNVRFAPKVTYLFKHPRFETCKGQGLEQAVGIVAKHFLKI